MLESPVAKEKEKGKKKAKEAVQTSEGPASRTRSKSKMIMSLYRKTTPIAVAQNIPPSSPPRAEDGNNSGEDDDGDDDENNAYDGTVGHDDDDVAPRDQNEEDLVSDNSDTPRDHNEDDLDNGSDDFEYSDVNRLSDSYSGDDTVVDGEERPFDFLNDAALLTTPELSSFDETHARINPISMDDFHGDSEGEGYETAESNESNEELPLRLIPVGKMHIKRLEEITPASKLISPITSTSKPIQQRLLEISTSTPIATEGEIAAGQHLVWNDGQTEEVMISKTGARIPVRRSNRNRDLPK